MNLNFMMMNEARMNAKVRMNFMMFFFYIREICVAQRVLRNNNLPLATRFHGGKDPHDDDHSSNPKNSEKIFLTSVVNTHESSELT